MSSVNKYSTLSQEMEWGTPSPNYRPDNVNKSRFVFCCIIGIVVVVTASAILVPLFLMYGNRLENISGVRDKPVEPSSDNSTHSYTHITTTHMNQTYTHVTEPAFSTDGNHTLVTANITHILPNVTESAINATELQENTTVPVPLVNVTNQVVNMTQQLVNLTQEIVNSTQMDLVQAVTTPVMNESGLKLTTAKSEGSNKTSGDYIAWLLNEVKEISDDGNVWMKIALLTTVSVFIVLLLVMVYFCIKKLKSKSRRKRIGKIVTDLHDGKRVLLEEESTSDDGL